MDYDRFLQEVLVPLKNKQAFSFCPYDCHAQAMADEVDPDEQLRRIISRNGEQDAVQFKEKWIPLEEQYFSFYKVRECCDAICVTEKFGR